MGNKLEDDWACTIRHHEKQLLYHLQMINTTNKPPPPPAKSPPPRPLVSSLPACTPSAKKSARPSNKRKSVGFCSEQAARQAAIESLPAWTDQSITSKAVNKRAKRTSKQVALHNFNAGAQKVYKDAKFSSVSIKMQPRSTILYLKIRIGMVRKGLEFVPFVTSTIRS